MPAPVFPDERTHVRSITRMLEGRDVEFHIYAEQYSMWFGRLTYNARHIRAEVPVMTAQGARLELIHSRETEPLIRNTPLPDERDQLATLEAEVTERIRETESLAEDVSYPRQNVA